MTETALPEKPKMISTGVAGLDAVLCGGLTPSRLYLVEGTPGAGKTTLALQFLMEGVRQGERVLYITLSESEDELRMVAESHDWKLEGVTIHEVIPDEEFLDPGEQYTMFHPSEVELGDTTTNILARVDEVKPTRVVIDSLSELRLLAGNPLKYRRQVLAFKQFFAKRNCTILMLDDKTAQEHDVEVKSIAHGVISMEQIEQPYGSDRRKIRIEKYRGVGFRTGYHDYGLYHGGLVVYQRLDASETRILRVQKQVSTGIDGFDALLGGGIEEGSSTILIGPSGTGKSTVAAQIVAAAIEQGHQAAMFLFEESANTLLNRTDLINIDMRGALEREALTIQQVDPAEMAPGEFAYAVQRAVEERKVKIVVIDSLNGYLHATPDERFLVTHMHELLTYLSQQGVITILVGVQSGLIGRMENAVDMSYLADNVVLMRHFEHQGGVRQAVSVFKKRGSYHEKSIRELSISPKGINIGPPLLDFHGVLTGVPVYRGENAKIHETLPLT